MSHCFTQLSSLLGLTSCPSKDDGPKSAEDEHFEPVLIRTPLARKKVLRSELSAEIWAAARTFLSNRNLEISFIEFWALHCLKNFDENGFDDLKQLCDSNEGVTVGQVSEAVKNFIHRELKNNAENLEREFKMAEALRTQRICTQFRSALRATRNTRTHMEDHFVILENILHPRCQKLFSLYIIFDGHNGSETALYAAKHLPHFLLSAEHPFNSFAIREAFIHTQSLLAERYRFNQPLSGGTTVVLALLCDNVVHFAWLGDSTAYGLANRQIVYKTSPHKPNRKDEFERIRRQGGCVTKASTFRINGISAVSRSLGDMALKPYVSHEPQLECFDNSRLDCIVLTSDGFSDFCPDTELIEAVYDTGEQNANSTCFRLIDLARKHNSDDNIMVMIIYSKWPPVGGDKSIPTTASSAVAVDDEFIVDVSRPLSAVVNLRKKPTSPPGSIGLRAHGGMRPYSSLV